MDAERRAEAYKAFDRWSEAPMLALSALLIPLIIVPAVVDLDPTERRLVFTLDAVIWAAFAFELIAKTYLAPNRLRYLVSHWYDVLIVLVPFFRPIRILRSARLFRLLSALRLVGVATRFSVSAREVLSQNGLQYALVLGLALVVGSAAAVLYFERGRGGDIDNFSTALWWAAVTVTTVGYGDAYPITPEGRGVAVFLMVVGITIFSLLTANISAFFVAHRDDGEKKATLDDVMVQLQRLEEQVAALRERVQSSEHRVSSNATNADE